MPSIQNRPPVYFGQDKRYSVKDFPLSHPMFQVPEGFKQPPRAEVKAHNTFYHLNAYLIGMPGCNGLSLTRTDKNGFEFNVYAKTSEDAEAFDEKVHLASNFSRKDGWLQKGWEALYDTTKNMRAFRRAYVRAVNSEQPNTFQGYKVNIIVGNPPDKDTPNVIEVMEPEHAFSKPVRDYLHA